MSDYSCIEVQRQSGVFNIGFVQRSFRTCKPKEVLIKSLYSSINYMIILFFTIRLLLEIS